MNEVKSNMDIINLSEYDISYEIQFIQLMIELLKPYILFEKPSEIFQDRKINMYQIIEGNKKMISQEKYIHYIQCTFPKMIQNMIHDLEEKKNYESIKKEIIDSKRKTKPYFKIPLFLENKEEETYQKLCQNLNNSNDDEISELKNFYYPASDCQYRTNMNIIIENIKYLEEISRINREKNGSITNVIQFMNNLNYYL